LEKVCDQLLEQGVMINSHCAAAPAFASLYLDLIKQAPGRQCLLTGGFFEPPLPLPK